MFKIRYIFYYTLAILILNSCASVKPPPGGPKDLQPPKLIYQYPAQQTTNFNKQQITLEFDERIKLQNASKQIIINPNLNTEYKTKVLNKKLDLIFEQPLQSNTTYSIKFGQSIRDITESNIQDSIHIEFSTGDQIDTMCINGVIKTNEEIKDIQNYYVQLINKDSTLEQKIKYTYKAKLNKDFTFQFNNIKKDEYHIIVFDDIDKDELFNYNANVGIIKNIKIDSTYELTLNVFDQQAPRISNTSKTDNNYNLTFDEKINQISITDTNNNLVENLYIIQEAKQVQLYADESITDIPYNIIIGDHHNNLDTVRITLDIPKYSMDTLPLSVNYKKGITLDSIIITSPQPIISSKNNTLNLIKNDSIHSNLNYDPLNRKYYTLIDPIQKNEDNVQIQIPSNEFFGINNATNQEYLIPIKPILKSNSSISGSINKRPDQSVILYLLKNNQPIKKMTVDDNTFSINNLNPGKYKIQVIYDDNKNGKWDQLQLNPFKQAEIIKYSKEIDVKENWDIEGIMVE